MAGQRCWPPLLRVYFFYNDKAGLAFVLNIYKILENIFTSKKTP